MKLIDRYNQYIYPALIILFVFSITCSYFFIRKVLQEELDEALLRAKSRIEIYVKHHQALPLITSFDDQKISFEKTDSAFTTATLRTSTQFIAEQNKYHISRQLVFPLQLQSTAYKAVITEPLEGTKHLTLLIMKIAVTTIFLLILLLFIINRRVIYSIWQPFYQSLAIIKSFKINNQTAPDLPVSSIEEFTLMNRHFDMAAKNAIRDFNSLKEFSENASHEIQTPLAIIHSKLDLLTQNEDLTEKQSEILQSIFTSVNKLSTVQQSLLLLTKIDNQQFHQKANLLFHHAAAIKIEEFFDLMHNRGIQYDTAIVPTTISCNKQLLDILLNNLFSNAIRHNRINGAINVETGNHRFAISNTGAEEALDPERIFKRFYKGTANGEHNGLGLSIIKRICEVSSIDINYYFEKGWHHFILCW